MWRFNKYGVYLVWSLKKLVLKYDYWDGMWGKGFTDASDLSSKIFALVAMYK